MFSLNLKMIQFTVIKESFTRDRFGKTNQLSTNCHNMLGYFLFSEILYFFVWGEGLLWADLRNQTWQ